MSRLRALALALAVAAVPSLLCAAPVGAAQRTTVETLPLDGLKGFRTDGEHLVAWSPADGKTVVLDTDSGARRDVASPPGFVLRAVGNGKLVWEAVSEHLTTTTVVIGDATTGLLAPALPLGSTESPVCSGETAIYGGVFAMGQFGVVTNCFGKGGANLTAWDSNSGALKPWPVATAEQSVLDPNSPTGRTPICDRLIKRPLVVHHGSRVAAADRFHYAAPYAVGPRWSPRTKRFFAGMELHTCDSRKVVTLERTGTGFARLPESVSLSADALSWRVGSTAKLRHLPSGRQLTYRVKRSEELRGVVHTRSALFLVVVRKDAVQIVRIDAPWGKV